MVTLFENLMREVGVFPKPEAEARPKKIWKAHSITNEQFGAAIKPFHTKAKRLEIGLHMASNLATISRMRGEGTTITQVQKKVITETIDTSKDVTRDIGYLAGQQAIHVAQISGMAGEIRTLEKQLRDRPTIEKHSFSLDWGLPNLGDLKTPLIVAAAVVGAALFLPSIIGALKKK